MKERFERFIAHEPNTGCWLWMGHVSRSGYGQFQVSTSRSSQAHRTAWELYRGPIPDGMVLDHKCRMRPCVNPDHLRVVTNRENVLENTTSHVAANLLKTACPKCGGAYREHIECGKVVRRCYPCRRRTLNAAERAKRRAAGIPACPQRGVRELRRWLAYQEGR